jgi:hypothetical protein
MTRKEMIFADHVVFYLWKNYFNIFYYPFFPRHPRSIKIRVLILPSVFH